MSDLSLLLDMGFPQHKAEKALQMTENKGVEPAMEWLLAHGDTMEVDAAPAESGNVANETIADENQGSAAGGASNVSAEESSEVTHLDETNIEAKCIQCDECNRKFKTNAEIEFHALKSGHQKFSQSSEELRPMTEEEKKEQLKKVESIIKQRRVEKQEQAQKEALEKEKSRRKTGQELIQARQRLKDEEIKNLAELKRKEKLEEKMARQRVLDQIERDKEARKEKFGMGGNKAPPVPVVPVEFKAPEPLNIEGYEECKIQIRLTNGTCLTHTFHPKEELAAVRLYVEINRTDGTGPFSLMTNFPKKVFSESDMDQPLSSLGLVPSAVLIVCKATQQ